jgi:RNA polymerase sigma factor (sigma-70 family)
MPAKNIPSHHQQIQQIVAGLARTETGKLVAVLTRIFGTHNLTLAEDIVQDVFIKAMEDWSVRSVPQNPVAWLYTAAKNKAIDNVRKYRRRKTFAADIALLLESEYSTAFILNDCFNEDEIVDDQLMMMFACCNPAIGREGQVALILKILCGFTIAQIARAFITSHDTIEKRLYRARAAFRSSNLSLATVIDNSLGNKLNNVLETIYLLFNEAYSASYHQSLTRKEMSDDAIQLCTLLVQHQATNVPQSNALLALLYFHSSRLASRTGECGELLLLKYQDRKMWDREMIEKGMYFLNLSATGDDMSRYHLEAAIAYEHCKAHQYDDTDWQTILGYFDILAQLVPSQVILLNRAIAINELQGAEKALDAIRAIPGIDYLQEYYLLHTILGELNMQTGDLINAAKHFDKALNLCVSETEKKLIQKRRALVLLTQKKATI